MAFEKRGKGRFFYRSVRHGKSVRKQYFGSGALGKLAAGKLALDRAERRAGREEIIAHRLRVEAATALLKIAREGCELLVAATLLAAGFHRASRHSWRRWYEGEKWLNGQRIRDPEGVA